MVVEVPAAIDLDSVPESKILQRGWKLGDLRHFHAADKNWNDRNVTLESHLDFDPDRIALIIHPAPNTFPSAQPPRSDNHQQYIRCSKRIGDLAAKIDARADAVDVAEYCVPAVLLREAVEYAAGDVLRIRSAIRDRYLRHVALTRLAWPASRRRLAEVHGPRRLDRTPMTAPR